ncbi:HET-domain-containing protein, partial [Amniculicola lignicola CBS 123094]
MASRLRRRSMSRLDRPLVWGKHGLHQNTANTPPDNALEPIKHHPDHTSERPFSYIPLHEGKSELRLVRVLPGGFNDTILVDILHVPFKVPKPVEVYRMTLVEVQDTLPDGYEVHENLEGRYIFTNKDTKYASWLHPDPRFPIDKYDPAGLSDPYLGYAPEYEALSYTWGREPATERLLVRRTIIAGANCMNDEEPLREKEKYSILLVRPNLMSALRHLRQLATNRIIWIDAVCINQESMSERSSQVKKMGDIYRLAHRVLVWLGPDSPRGFAEQAVKSLKLAGAQLEHTVGRLFVPSPLSQGAEWIFPRNTVPYDNEEGRAIQKFLEQSWFDRLWIWQEVHLANCRAEVHCGNHSLSWSLLRKAILFLRNRRDSLPSSISADLLDSRADLAGGIDTDGAGLLVNLWRTCDAQYTVDHDRVFSLFGLTDREFVSRIKADYSQPITSLFQDVCLTNIDLNQTLGFLDFCNPAELPLPDQPSWVPNWLQPPRHSRNSFCYFASADSGCGDIWYEGGNILDTYGVLVDQLVSVSNRSVVEDIPSIIENNKERLASDDPYRTGESFLTAFHSTVCCGLTAEKWSHRSHPTETDLRTAYGLAVPEELIRDSETGFFKDRAALERFLSRGLNGRVWFETRDYIGLCLPVAKPGDLICVLLGYGSPVILRPLGDDKYKFIGRAYVHGLMDGEAILGPLPPGWRVKYEFSRTGNALQVFLFG